MGNSMRAVLVVCIFGFVSTMLWAPRALPARASARVDSPAHALKHASYDHVSFTYNSAIAGAVTGDYMLPSPGPAGVSAPYIEFHFAQYMVTSARQEFRPPSVLGVFRWSPSSPNSTLATVLQKRPSVIAAHRLFIANVEASELVVARAHYFSFRNGSGIAYVTAFAQNSVPVIRGMLEYVYQGITGDRHVYLSLVLPVNTTALPVTANFHYDSTATLAANDARYAAGIAKTKAKLEVLPDSAFTPRLSALDAMARTILAKPSFAPPATVTKFVNTTQLGGTGANLRATPDTQSAVLAFIPNGTSLQVVSTPVTGADGAPWYEVTYNGVQGYVSATLLSPNKSQAAPSHASRLLNVNWMQVAGTSMDCSVPGIGREVDSVRTYDITGDGVSDSFVQVACRTGDASAWDQLEVYDGASDPAALRRLGIIIQAPNTHNEEVYAVTGMRIRALAFSGHRVTVTGAMNRASDPIHCHSLIARRTATWNGHGFDLGPIQTSPANGCA